MSKKDSTHPKGQNEDKLLNALKSGDTETAKKLLELPNIDINCKDEDGDCPLILAVKLNYFDIVKILTKKGVEIVVYDKNGKDPLALSIKNNNMDILDLLAKYLNQGDEKEEGHKKFFDACNKGDLNLVKKILNESNIDINIKNPNYFGYTALHYASDKGYEEIVKEFLKYPNINVEARCFKHGENPKFSIGDIDYTPLHLAVKNKHIAIAELLLKNGANVNARLSLNSDESSDYTPLIFACDKSDVEMVKLLINYNADVNFQISQRARNIRGYTPLHLAVENGNINIMRILIENGANINAIDAKYKQTPLMYACILGFYDIVVDLIKYGADKNIKDKLNNTALGWAKNYINESFNMPKEESFLKIIDFLSD